MSENVSNVVNFLLTYVGIFILVFIFFGALFSLPVMWLWDWLMPSLFNLREIKWVEAWGILVLCGLLFKGPTPVKSK